MEDPTKLIKDPTELMPHADRFFDHCRRTVMAPSLDNDEVGGAKAVLAAMEDLPLAWTAYALATAWHETSHTMQPVREAYWLSDRSAKRYFTRMYDVAGRRPSMARRMGNTARGDGARYFGRGYVQLTWKVNYSKAGDKLGLDLVNDPDRAMEPDIAAQILRHGMRGGWFTGKRFDSYLPAAGRASRRQFTRARYIINGRDKAGLIAGYALEFQDGLELGGWPW